MKVDSKKIIQEFNTWVENGGLKNTHKDDLNTIKEIVQNTLNFVDDDSHFNQARVNILKSVKMTQITTNIQNLETELNLLLKCRPKGRDFYQCGASNQ